MIKIVTDTSAMKTSGMSNGQLKGFALVSKIREWWAEDNSKELNEASWNNRSLAFEAISVAESEWELIVTDWFPFVFYKASNLNLKIIFAFMIFSFSINLNHEFFKRIIE